jgi:hypothetical protein
VALRPISGLGHERSPGAYADNAGTLSVSVSGAWASATPPIRHALTVERTGQGRVSGGTVIDCPGTCSETFDAGSEVTLRAEPEPGWRLNGWSEAGCGTQLTCAVTVAGPKTVVAHFVRIRYELTVDRTGEGSVTGGTAIECPGTCSQSFDQGTVVTLQAAPAAHWSFVRWEGDAECSGAADCAVTMDRDRTVRAVFERIRHRLTVELTGDGAGSVASTSHPDTIACPGDCDEIYDEGALVTLQATPDQGSRLAGWSVESCGSQPTCVVPIDAARTVIATFRQAERTLTVVITGGGSGRVTSDPARIDCEPDCVRAFADASTVRLTPQADPGSYFVGWDVQSCPDPVACSVLMDESKTVAARFEKIPRRLTAVIFGSGTVTLPPDGPVCSTTCHRDYADGDVITITAEPAPGWRFKAWSGGGACSGEASACAITMNDAKSVTATFEQIDPPRRLTAIVLPERGGRVTGIDPALDCSTTCHKDFAHGPVVNLRAEPAAGYRFVQWSGGAPCTGTNPACDVRMDGDRSVTASFERVNAPTYRLIPGVFDPGMGRVVDPANAIDCRAYTCGANYASGTAFTLRAEAMPGYRFLSWALGPCARSTLPTCAFALRTPTNPVAKFARLGTPRPTLGRTAVTRLLSGSVSYRPPATPRSAGRAAQADTDGAPDAIPFVPLDPRKPVPVGSTVDATNGVLRLTVQTARRKHRVIKLSGGMFVFRQASKGRWRGRTLLELTTAEPNPCAASSAKRLLQRLNASGRDVAVRTRASESTSRRATWTTEDRCDGTKTKVRSGTVIVRDLAKRRAITLRAGRSHLARARTITASRRALVR